MTVGDWLRWWFHGLNGRVIGTSLPARHTPAIVTAANGIGRAVALVLAEQGCAVTIADRDIETGEQVAEHIRAHGGRSTFVETDVSSEASIENLVESAVATYGRLDALVNVAGVNILARLLDTTVERCASTRSVVQPTSIARPADQATTEFADT